MAKHGTPGLEQKDGGFLGFAFFWLPTLRWFPTYVKTAEHGLYGELDFWDGVRTAVREIYEYHMEYLRRMMAREKLVLYNMKEGWGPLVGFWASGCRVGRYRGRMMSRSWRKISGRSWWRV